MSDPGFWGQSWWQGVGVIVGIIGLIIGGIGIYIAMRQNKRKSLAYKILYSGDLISVNKGLKNDLKITYKGHEVEYLNIIKINLVNNGEIPIKKEEFEEPISIKLSYCKNIFSSIITERFPDNIRVISRNDHNTIYVDPLLINPGESFSIQITFDGENRNFNLVTRIEGISLIEILEYQSINSPLFLIASVAGKAMLDGAVDDAFNQLRRRFFK